MIENNHLLFSIIIPTYNHAHLIRRCLEGILSQSCESWEAIIINNFSSDDTIKIIQSYSDSRFHLINYSNNGIIAASRNKGIRLAKGEWICFLDSDDWWKSNKLESCLPYLSNNDIIYHDLEICSAVSHCNRHKKYRSRNLKDNIKHDLLINGNALLNSSVVVRKTVLDKVGPLEEDKKLVAIEDFDYWIRISEYTNRFLYIPRILGYYWIGDQNISHGIEQIDREKALLDKHYKKLTIKDQRRACVFLNYKIARIYHKNMKYTIAHKYYLNVLLSFRLKKYLFKSLLGYILVLFHVKK
jgi:glycosyltransferase involved in cell wall biosynthesis